MLITSNYVKNYKLKHEMNEIEYNIYINKSLTYEVIGHQPYKEIIEDMGKENLTLYNEAINLIEEKYYINAIKKFDDIESDYKNYDEVIN